MSTPDEVREHNEQVLRNVDRIALVDKFMLSIGCNDGQAATVAKAYAEKFTYDGVALSFNGKPVIQARDDVIAHFKANKLDFLLPAPNADNMPNVDPDLLASARAGNQTARTNIYKQLGDVAATDALIAAKPGDDKSKENASTNPWRSPNFRTDKAAQAKAAGIIKSLGTKAAASMAKSAGKDLSGAPLKAA
jgi:hypothetical protein